MPCSDRCWRRRFVTLGARSCIGADLCLPAVHARCSINSTDRLDLYGEWHEPDDDAAAPESKARPVDRHRRDAAFQVKVTGPAHYASDGVGAGRARSTPSRRPT